MNPIDRFGLNNQHAIVTGSATGTGRGIAWRFAAADGRR